MMSDNNTLQLIITALIPLVFAITLHEAAHAWVARYYGDNTAASLGRVTLNPIKHIDPLGTIIIPLVMLKLGGFIFGWAKPVPLNWQNLKNPRRDKALVALAGPAANIFMAIFWAIIASIIVSMDLNVESSTLNLVQFALSASVFGIQINLILCFLNLLPLPPLDGSRVIASMLKPQWATQYDRIEPFGIFILLALLVTGALSAILGPILQYSINTLYTLFGLL